MRQTWILIIISILFVMALQSCSPHWDTQYWCFGFARKAFLSTIFLIIKVHPWNDSNLDSHNNLYSFSDSAQQSCSPRWNTRYWCFGFARKAFLSAIFPIIKVHLWKELNLDSHNNLHSFHNWAQQSCSPYWDTRY